MQTTAGSHDVVPVTKTIMLNKKYTHQQRVDAYLSLVGRILVFQLHIFAIADWVVQKLEWFQAPTLRRICHPRFGEVVVGGPMLVSERTVEFRPFIATS